MRAAFLELSPKQDGLVLWSVFGVTMMGTKKKTGWGNLNKHPTLIFVPVDLFFGSRDFFFNSEKFGGVVWFFLLSGRGWASRQHLRPLGRVLSQVGG